MEVHKVSAFHPFIFQKSGKSTIIRNLAVPRHFVAYLVFISSIRVDPGPRNRGPTSLLALKIRTPWQTQSHGRSCEFRMHMKNPAQTGSGCICFNYLNFHEATFAEYSCPIRLRGARLVYL